MTGRDLYSRCVVSDSGIKGGFRVKVPTKLLLYTMDWFVW